jgi:hypothetical protein
VGAPSKDRHSMIFSNSQNSYGTTMERVTGITQGSQPID